MIGPYTAKEDGTIAFTGNKVIQPISDVCSKQFPKLEQRVNNLATNEIWPRIAHINHTINIAANTYFDTMGALYTPLPLTTRMISSPGAVYGKEKLNYTTDTCPITLNWFDLEAQAFLAESSQIYLELSLLQRQVNHVYAIYNSFRKEAADPTHLSEFHHIEYEGKVTQQENKKIVTGLLRTLLADLLRKNEADLAHFLNADAISYLQGLSEGEHFYEVEFKDALAALHNETKQDKYAEFTLKHFGSWEEIKLTEIYGGLLGLSKFPLLEVPFYHAPHADDTTVADNTDFIWPGYREVAGSGHRVRSTKELEQKAEIFNLPRKDYAPYLQSRRVETYQETSGFGMGWERFLHGILRMPFIWSAVQFPRGHSSLVP